MPRGLLPAPAATGVVVGSRFLVLGSWPAISQRAICSPSICAPPRSPYTSTRCGKPGAALVVAITLPSAPLVKRKMSTLAEYEGLAGWLFEPLAIEPAAWDVLTADVKHSIQVIRGGLGRLEELPDWTLDAVKDALQDQLHIMGEAVRDLCGAAQRCEDRERTAGDHLAQRFAGVVGHRDEESMAVELARQGPGRADLVHDCDVRMIERGRRACFRFEPRTRL